MAVMLIVLTRADRRATSPADHAGGCGTGGRRQYLDAREHRDAQALADLFTADADQLIPPVSGGRARRDRSGYARLVGSDGRYAHDCDSNRALPDEGRRDG